MGLHKRYGRRVAVHSLDLDVRAGETFGFLGPNGAGKSTAISMLCTLTRPTGGRAEVAGADVATDPDTVRHNIGLTFQESTVDEELTAQENLRFHGELWGVPRAELRRRITELLELMGLSERRHDLLRTYSGGMKRRLEIARSLVHAPHILFLDEPTVGLDPQTRMLIWDHLHALREQRAITLFLTTHYLEEAEHCDRIAILDKGRVVAEDTPTALKSAVGTDLVVLRTSDDQAACRALRAELGLAAAVAPDGVRVEAADGAALVPRLFARLTTDVHTVTVRRPSLDDVFTHFTGRAIRDPAPATVAERTSAGRSPSSEGGEPR
ncbi:ATP-binding cassette domain-containing protein [Streptomyces albidoflavus]|uniref:ATP-binding cassette domain-containing protein n=1 Tax=Streptomyces albidoflavus TaxID=1886 RepID=UPI0033B9243D